MYWNWKYTVYRVCKDHKQGAEFKELEKRDCEMAVPEEIILQVCRVLMGMYKAKIHATLDTQMQKLKEKTATRQSG